MAHLSHLARDLERAILFDHPEATAHAAKRLMRQRDERPWIELLWILASQVPISGVKARFAELAKRSSGPWGPGIDHPNQRKSRRSFRPDACGHDCPLWEEPSCLGESTAMRAAKTCKFKALAALLECGADPWTRDALGSDLAAAISLHKPSWMIDESARDHALQALSAARVRKERRALQSSLAPAFSDLALRPQAKSPPKRL